MHHKHISTTSFVSNHNIIVIFVSEATHLPKERNQEKNSPEEKSRGVVYGGAGGVCACVCVLVCDGGDTDSKVITLGGRGWWWGKDADEDGEVEEEKRAG